MCGRAGVAAHNHKRRTGYGPVRRSSYGLAGLPSRRKGRRLGAAGLRYVVTVGAG